MFPLQIPQLSVEIIKDVLVQLNLTDVSARSKYIDICRHLFRDLREKGVLDTGEYYGQDAGEYFYKAINHRQSSGEGVPLITLQLAFKN